MLEIGILKEEELKECHDLCELCFEENVDYSEIEEIYDKFKNNDMYKFIVAKIDGKIVGYTSMILFYDLFDGKRPIASLWFVCVHPDYRRQKVATQLFEYIEKIAKDYNCEAVCFTSETDNLSAHSFYQKIGYDQTAEKAFYKKFN